MGVVFPEGNVLRESGVIPSLSNAYNVGGPTIEYIFFQGVGFIFSSAVGSFTCESLHLSRDHGCSLYPKGSNPTEQQLLFGPLLGQGLM